MVPRRKKPTAVAETIEHLKDEIPELKPASQIPRQLPAPEPVLQPLKNKAEPAPRELIEPSPDTTRPRPSHDFNGSEHPLPTFAQRVSASRQGFRPVPLDYLNVDSYPAAGLKVNRSRDKTTAAIQFSEESLPSREEKDALQIKGVSYDPSSRQWIRRDHENPGANLIDMKDVGAEIAGARATLDR